MAKFVLLATLLLMGYVKSKAQVIFVIYMYVKQTSHSKFYTTQLELLLRPQPAMPTPMQHYILTSVSVPSVLVRELQLWLDLEWLHYQEPSSSSRF